MESIPSILVAVGAVIAADSGKVLLVRHRPERGGYWKGRWICPGGGLNVGESIRQGIRREVREETHLEIDLIRPLVPFERIVKAGGEVELHVIYIDWLARMTGGELQPDDDVGEARWMSRDDLHRNWDELHADTQKLLTIAGVMS